MHALKKTPACIRTGTSLMSAASAGKKLASSPITVTRSPLFVHVATGAQRRAFAGLPEGPFTDFGPAAAPASESKRTQAVSLRPSQASQDVHVIPAKGRDAFAAGIADKLGPGRTARLSLLHRASILPPEEEPQDDSGYAWEAARDLNMGPIETGDGSRAEPWHMDKPLDLHIVRMDVVVSEFNTGGEKTGAAGHAYPLDMFWKANGLPNSPESIVYKLAGKTTPGEGTVRREVRVEFTVQTASGADGKSSGGK